MTSKNHARALRALVEDMTTSDRALLVSRVVELEEQIAEYEQERVATDADDDLREQHCAKLRERVEALSRAAEDARKHVELALEQVALAGAETPLLLATLNSATAELKSALTALPSSSMEGGPA